MPKRNYTSPKNKKNARTQKDVRADREKEAKSDCPDEPQLVAAVLGVVAHAAT